MVLFLFLKETGVYQIYVKAMQEDGIGALYREYEELKKKLEQEGLFSQEHKKKIRIRSEEAQTKLLLPMFLTLAAILVMVAAPAMMSMQI